MGVPPTPPWPGGRALRVCLLGGFRVQVGTRPVEDDAWRLRKARSVIKLLALTPGHALHREQLMDAFWPDLPPEAAVNNLHKALHVARRALEPHLPSAGPSTYLRLRDDLVTLTSPETLWIDVEAFQSAAAAARKARTPDAYRAALALYPGDLLPEDRFEDWVAPRREAHRAGFLALLLEQARAHEERREWADGVEALRRVLVSEPAHEDAHVGLMRLHARAGRRNLALRQYEQLREALARELDAEPDPASQGLHAAILAGRFPPSHGDAPAIVGGTPASRHAVLPRGAPDEAEPARPRPRNLPVQLSSFIGRQREIAEARRLLATTRLLTLTGAGGSGKSRLAIELAAGVEPQFPDGVWLAELASLQDPSLLPASVQAVLGVPDQPDPSAEGALVEELRGKRALLVLDNCEHLVDACAQLVVTLLRACPRLTIVATSRQPLGIAGETIYRVPSLSRPGSAGVAPGDDPLQYDAIRLFIERARLVVPTFTITPHNAQLIVEVCRRLDGMPLALELAAARARLLSVEQIAGRLGDCFRLLTGGNRLGLPRHQTLRATLDWSHQLLADSERVMFRRLAVFAGGFSLAAAEVVCADAGDEVLDLLAQLVDKSLVGVEEHGSEPRYRLLETVRQYARERLAEAGETATISEQHFAWHVALAAQAEPELWGPQQKMWLDRLQAEHDNLRQALAWSLEHDVAGALRLAGHLARFWLDRGYPVEGHHWLERALAAPGPRLPRGRALQALGIMSLDQGDPATARPALDEAVSILRETGETWHLGQALLFQGRLALSDGDREGARRLYEDSLAVFTSADHRQGTAMAIAHLGRYHTMVGNCPLARELLDEALGRFRETGDLRGVGFSLGLLGNLAWQEGDLRRAKGLWRENLVVTRDIGQGSGMVGAINQLGRLAGCEGSPGLEVRLMAAAATAATSYQVEYTAAADSAARAASLAEARAALGEDAFASAWAEGEGMTLEQAIDVSLAWEALPDR